MEAIIFHPAVKVILAIVLVVSMIPIARTVNNAYAGDSYGVEQEQVEQEETADNTALEAADKAASEDESKAETEAVEPSTSPSGSEQDATSSSAEDAAGESPVMLAASPDAQPSANLAIDSAVLLKKDGTPLAENETLWCNKTERTISVKVTFESEPTESFKVTCGLFDGGTQKWSVKSENQTPEVGKTDYTVSFNLSEISGFENGEYTVRVAEGESVTLDDTLCPGTLGMDKTDPELNVAYNPESTRVITYGEVAYYDGVRTANITVTEANFDASLIAIDVEGTPVPEQTAWVYEGDDKHTCTVKFEEGSGYRLQVSGTDKAQNPFVESYDSGEFVIDKTPPTVECPSTVASVTEKSSDGVYYLKRDGSHTVTVTVTEANLDALAQSDTCKGTLLKADGKEYTLKGLYELSGTTSGHVEVTHVAGSDTLVATVQMNDSSYANDGTYEIAVAPTVLTDLSGNACTSAGDSWKYVADSKAPVLTTAVYGKTEGGASDLLNMINHYMQVFFYHARGMKVVRIVAADSPETAAASGIKSVKMKEEDSNYVTTEGITNAYVEYAKRFDYAKSVSNDFLLAFKNTDTAVGGLGVDGVRFIAIDCSGNSQEYKLAKKQDGTIGVEAIGIENVTAYDADGKQIAGADASPTTLVNDEKAPTIGVTKDVKQSYEYDNYTYLKSIASQSESKEVSTWEVKVTDVNLAMRAKAGSDEESSIADPVIAEIAKEGGASTEYTLGDLYKLATEVDKSKGHVSASINEDETELTAVFSLNGESYKDAEGKYSITVPANAVTDLSGNVSDNEGHSLKYVVDETAPTVECPSTVASVTEKSSDGVYYLKHDGSHTVTVTVTEANLDALAQSDTCAGTLLKVDGKEYTLQGLYELSGTTSGHVEVTHVAGSDKLVATVQMNDSSYANDGTYEIAVAPTVLTDLSGNACTSVGDSWKYVADSKAPVLTAAVYGKTEGGASDLLNMINHYMQVFFYHARGMEVVRIVAADSPENAAASGIKSVKMKEDSGYVTTEGITNGYVEYAKRFDYKGGSVSNDFLLAFKNTDTAIDGLDVDDVGFIATDCSGNLQEYKLAKKEDGSIGVEAVGIEEVTAYDAKGEQIAGEDASPTTLVNDEEAPTSSLYLDGLETQTFHNSDQHVGTVDVKDVNLEKLMVYAKNNPGDTTYNAQIVNIRVDDIMSPSGTASFDVPVNVADLTGPSESEQLTDLPTGSYSYAFNMNADYTVTYTPGNISDLSNNKNSGDGTRTVSFTVDTIAPTCSVTWDNEDVRNGKYYKAGRTATITINEHNFDSSLVTVNTNGSQSGWSSNGDTRTMTVSFTTDGVYNLAVSGTDQANNAFETFTSPEFVIDLTAPTIDISFPNASSSSLRAFNDTVTPSITFQDEANFDTNGIGYTLTGNERGQVSYAVSTSDSGNGQVLTYADFDRTVNVDDIYTLRATLTDLAGNEAVEKSETFSVNRFGSNFIIVDKEAYADKYLAAARDVVVQEVNVSGPSTTLEESGDAKNVSVTYGLTTTNLDRVSDTGEKGYKVEYSEQSNGWSVATYTVGKVNFLSDTKNKGKDGQYHVTVTSEDKAGNTNISSDYYDHENAKANASAVVDFVLDTEKPVVSNLSVTSGEIYDANENSKVTFEAYDNVGLKDVSAELDGKTLEVKNEGNNTYSVQVDAANWTGRDLKVTATDYAKNNADDQANGFHMTTDFLELHIVPIVIVAVIIVAGGVVAVAIRRKKRTEEEKLDAPTTML